MKELTGLMRGKGLLLGICRISLDWLRSVILIVVH
jgi:hypothetical protein